MQLHRSIRALRKRLNPALAGLLAVLLFLATTSAAAHLLHHAGAGDAAAAHHACGLCLFAKGQVNAAEGGAVLAALVVVFLFALAWTPVAARASLDLRLAPGRAPPSLSRIR